MWDLQRDFQCNCIDVRKIYVVHSTLRLSLKLRHEWNHGTSESIKITGSPATNTAVSTCLIAANMYVKNESISESIDPIAPSIKAFPWSEKVDKMYEPLNNCTRLFRTELSTCGTLPCDIPIPLISSNTLTTESGVWPVFAGSIIVFDPSSITLAYRSQIGGKPNKITKYNMPFEIIPNAVDAGTTSICSSMNKIPVFSAAFRCAILQLPSVAWYSGNP